jgi:hypothetical protein
MPRAKPRARAKYHPPAKPMPLSADDAAEFCCISNGLMGRVGIVNTKDRASRIRELTKSLHLVCELYAEHVNQKAGPTPATVSAALNKVYEPLEKLIRQLENLDDFTANILLASRRISAPQMRSTSRHGSSKSGKKNASNPPSLRTTFDPIWSLRDAVSSVRIKLSQPTGRGTWDDLLLDLPSWAFATKLLGAKDPFRVALSIFADDVEKVLGVKPTAQWNEHKNAFDGTMIPFAQLLGKVLLPNRRQTGSGWPGSTAKQAVADYRQYKKWYASQEA